MRGIAGPLKMGDGRWTGSGRISLGSHCERVRPEDRLPDPTGRGFTEIGYVPKSRVIFKNNR